MGLLFNLIPEINQHQQLHSKVAESENIGANHLGFTKSLFQHYSFNFYVNERIAYLLGIPINTESARKTFYNELIQNTSLPTNHNFASIITEINKEIEHHTQQRYPIIYASKGKGKLQTPMITLKRIQPPTWKKTKIELPTAPSYHYTLGSAINITSANASTLNMISTFGQFPFQKEEESEDQEFTYQNPILENPEFGTPNVQTQQKNPEIKIPNIQALQNQNPKVINQHLPSVIVINQLPVEPIGQPIQTPNQQNQQPPPVLPQQQQQLLPQQQQQMAYAPIIKLDKFTGEENDTQVWLNNIEKTIAANGWNDTRAIQAISYFFKDTANSWYQSLVNKPQDFNTFKLEFLRYFSNNNSINRLVNTFTTIKQGETEAVTTYLGRFHRNLIIQHTIISGAALKKKPITAMYTNAKVDGHIIKLILDSGSADSIITRQLMDQLGCRSNCHTQPEWATHASTSNMWPFQGDQHHGTTNRLRGREAKTYLKSIPSVVD
ncbi:hypothetical protein G9A89_003612 [Geosiphon pyriformis]|nr:hypothetical protein G9A89_003612 [Geosiphon pyriformis]